MDTMFHQGGQLMKNNRNHGSNNNNNNQKRAISSGKLEVLASAILTIGEALGTIAAGMALEEEERAKAQAQFQTAYDKDEMRELRKQIDYLIHEINQINKKLK